VLGKILLVLLLLFIVDIIFIYYIKYEKDIKVKPLSGMYTFSIKNYFGGWQRNIYLCHKIHYKENISIFTRDPRRVKIFNLVSYISDRLSEIVRDEKVLEDLCTELLHKASFCNYHDATQINYFNTLAELLDKFDNLSEKTLVTYIKYGVLDIKE